MERTTAVKTRTKEKKTKQRTHAIILPPKNNDTRNDITCPKASFPRVLVGCWWLFCRPKKCCHFRALTKIALSKSHSVPCIIWLTSLSLHHATVFFSDGSGHASVSVCGATRCKFIKSVASQPQRTCTHGTKPPENQTSNDKQQLKSNQVINENQFGRIFSMLLLLLLLYTFNVQCESVPI